MPAVELTCVSSLTIRYGTPDFVLKRVQSSA